MKKMFGSAVAAAVMALSIVVGASAGPAMSDTGEQFVRALYAKYVPHGNPTAFDYPDAGAIVDATMLRALQRDNKMAKGEVGAIDSDPLCQCQDWERLKILSLHVAQTRPDASVAQVTFTDSMDHRVDKLKLELVRINGRWKIHDIGSKETPSLLEYLRTYKY